MCSPGASISTPLIDRCAKENIPIIFCNQKYFPTSITTPIDYHGDQTRRIRTQIDAKTSVKNMLWKQIVIYKIYNQLEVLRHFNLDGTARLERLAKLVKAADIENVEAKAAQIYWPSLFGRSFRRDRTAEDQNVLLNYGYTIIRSTMLSAILSVGLNPSISLHHKNRTNPFCLVDDLMEPFRPIIDQIVKRLSEKNIVELNGEVKSALSSVVSNDMSYGGSMVAHHQNMITFVHSYLSIMEKGRGKLDSPNLFSAIELESILSKC